MKTSSYAEDRDLSDEVKKATLTFQNWENYLIFWKLRFCQFLEHFKNSFHGSVLALSMRFLAWTPYKDPS